MTAHVWKVTGRTTAVTAHDWKVTGGMEVCTKCLAFSMVPGEMPPATVPPVPPGRHLMIMVQGLWQDPVPCPDTCEEVEEIRAGFEVHSS